jgi:hypothetical protein
VSGGGAVRALAHFFGVSGGGAVRALAHFFLLHIMIHISFACPRKKL